MKTHTSIAACGLITILSACGGGSTGSGNGNVVFDIQDGSAPPTYNPNTGVLSLNGTPIAGADDDAINTRGAASVTHDTTTDIFQARVENGDVFAVTYEDVDGGRGTIYGREAIPDLTNGGGATFTGDYAGLSIRSPSTAARAFSAAVTGDVTINVDLDRMEVDGSITNREVVGISGNNFSNPVGAADVTLEVANLRDDGLFSGAVSGGQFTQSGATFTPKAMVTSISKQASLLRTEPQPFPSHCT